jgi:predicted nucleotidyltransferase
MELPETGIQTAIELAMAYGATRLVLFGSYLNTPDQARDLDLAVDGVSGWKLYELDRLSRPYRKPDLL